MQLLRTINLPLIYQRGMLGSTEGHSAIAAAQLLALTTCIFPCTRRFEVPPGFPPDVPTQALRKAYRLIPDFKKIILFFLKNDREEAPASKAAGRGNLLEFSAKL